MATPVYDRLNVMLAYRLGDPYQPGGSVVTYSTDGIAYPAALRDDIILSAARRVLFSMGPRALANKGIRESYVRTQQLTATDTQLPADCARVLDVDYYGKKAEDEHFVSGRLNSIFWQNVPMYRVEQASDSANRKIILTNIHKDPFTATLFYLREIPALTHGGSEDLTLDTYMQEHVLNVAEALGRRLHQEFGMVKEAAMVDMKLHKEND